MRVKFLNGGGHTVPLTELRGFSMLPGQEVQANWPVWGWWAVEVEKYDPQKKRVRVTDGWSSKSFALSQVRLPE